MNIEDSIGMELSVREMIESDIDLMMDYWESATPEYLRGMGADPGKIKPRDEFSKFLKEQLSLSYRDKSAYCIIWIDGNGCPIGHTNIGAITFGKEAYMHLHSWYPSNRRSGLGTRCVKAALPYFFKNFELNELYCQPYALNDAPNRTLERVGFSFVKEFVTTPGPVNFEQPVKLWKISREQVLE